MMRFTLNDIWRRFDIGCRCRLAALNITVSRSLANVEEWRTEKELNVSYEMEVHYLHHNGSVANELIQIVHQFVDIALPVLEECRISVLKVCRMPDCVCALWNPPRAEISQLKALEVGSERKSYVLIWQMEKQDCIDHYEVLLEGTSVRTKIPFVTLEGVTLFSQHRVLIKVIHQNGDAMQRYFDIFVYPASKADPEDQSQCSFKFFIQKREERFSDNPATFNISDEAVCMKSTPLPSTTPSYDAALGTTLS
uniref:Uncharacterized protein n=1 Tax=Anopheles culicifacies TaxID=139723 RepID=A0A182MLZ2_9DIPT